MPYHLKGKGRGSPHSITERRVPELIPVLGSQPAGGVSHKPGGRLPLLSIRPAVTPTTLKMQSFTARMSLLTATSAFGLWSIIYTVSVT